MLSIVKQSLYDIISTKEWFGLLRQIVEKGGDRFFTNFLIL